MAIAEFSSSTLVTAVLVILISALAWRVLKLAWFQPKKVEKMLKQQGLFGNSYSFLIGDLTLEYKLRKTTRSSPPTSFSHDILSLVEPLMHETIKKHGNNSFGWMGPTPMIYPTDPELIKEVYTRPDDFVLPMSSFLEFVVKGVTSYEGEMWRKARKVVNPCFHPDNLKLMVPPFYESCASMIVRWEKKIDESGLFELDVFPEFQSLAGDAISRAAFTSSYEEGIKLFQLISEQYCLLQNNLELSFIPGWRLLPTKANRRMMEIDQQLDNLTEGIVTKRMKEMMTIKKGKTNDMLDSLLESNKQHCSLTTKEVVEQCKMFFLAGQPTTSLLLTWTMIVLSKHQNWQEKAREEVLNTFGNNMPDYDDLNKLKKVNMVLHEVLRLYPPAERVYKRVKKDCKLGNISLPANTLLNISMLLINKNPDIWGEDVDEFNPERFSEGTFKATRGNMAFIPFGYGPRVCLGQNFVLLEVKMVITMLLRRFSFELSPSYCHAPIHSAFLVPEFGAQVVLCRL